MNVRAKFKVESNTNGAVALRAVYEGDGGVNKSWAVYTPSGQIAMQINNPAAAEQFVVGACVYVDFSAVPEGE